MNEIFNIDKKQKPLVDIPGFTFVGYHNLQPGVCYYVRKYDNSNNFDFVEAKIVKTGNKVKDRYTLTAGTGIKILDSFMYSYLKHKNENLKYYDFIETTLKESNMDNEEFRKRFMDGNIPKEIKNKKAYKAIINDKYQVLYVSKSPKEQKLEQIYIVFVKETEQKLMDVDINYITFKPVQFITKLAYLKGKSTDKYLVYEYPEINIPTSILK